MSELIIKEMNKVFSYRGYSFNINVKLNYRNIRRAGKITTGEAIEFISEHLITVNCMDKSNFCMKRLCVSSKLKEEIQHLTDVAIKNTVSLDGHKSPDEITLASLGFK